MKRIALLCLFLLSLNGCSSLLFYPEPGQLFTPDKAHLAYRDVTLTTADGVHLHAWWLPAKPGVPVKGTVLHLHGNGGNLAMHLGGSWWLPEQGWQVLLVDYRGYGLSEGEPALPAIYSDIDAAFDWLANTPDAQGKPLVLLGQSIGGSLAVHYLVEHPQQRQRLKALVLDGAPASYRDIAQHTLAGSVLTWPFQVPLAWLIPDGDSAERTMAQLDHLPKLIFQSIDDTQVPLNNGINLYKLAPPPRVLQLTRGAHVQTFAYPVWRQVMLKFLDDPYRFNSLRRLAEVPEDTPDDPALNNAEAAPHTKP